MRNVRTKYVHAAENADFSVMVTELLSAYRPQGIPVRMIFFGSPESNVSFCQQKERICTGISQKYGEHSPVVSYIAQTPLDGSGMVLEVHEILPEAGDRLEYKRFENIPYIVLSGKEGDLLFLGAVSGADIDASVQRQSEEIFTKIQKVLQAENMPVNAIVRQWNYLERITGFEGDIQRYQAFNDARSVFYEQTEWECGYPSATGIGTSFGGVQVELQAFLPKQDGKMPVALDNHLQIAAHAYSQQVLLGQKNSGLKMKTTPKFERAKLVFTPMEKIIYISGTAAIRGESSLIDADIQSQTLATIENIEYLISAESQLKAGMQDGSDARIESFRVYVKHISDMEKCKAVVSQRYPDVPVIYVKADICRDELLVEIEGVALSKIN